MLSKETIRQELDDITHKLQQKYNEKYIFGVFVLGNATYNLAEDIDELAYMMVRLPSFEEMCLRTPEIFFDEDYHNVEIIDWGVFGNFYVQQNNILIQQFLFTDYYNVNPRYKKYYENVIRPAAEDIFAYGYTARLQSAKEIALEILKSEQMCLTGLQAMEVARLALAIDLYLHNTPCEECVKLNKSMYISYLLDIKHGNTAINPDELLTQMTIPSAKNNEEPKQIKQLIGVAHKHPNLPIRVSTVDRFQGMERNIVIVSMVRSNIIQSSKNQKPDKKRYPDYGFPIQKSLGFAQSPNRLNVALSRAKRLLVIVGNKELFSQLDIYQRLFMTIEANINNKVISQEEV